MSLHVASYQAKPHDAGFLRTLLAVLFGRADFFGHIITPHRTETRVGKKLLCTPRDQIQLPKAEFLRPSKKTLKERGANSSVGVLWFDDYKSQ